MRPFFYLLFAHPEVAAVVGSRVVESVITDTIKHHPALFIFVAAMVIGVLYFSYSTFALKADLKAVEVRIACWKLTRKSAMSMRKSGRWMLRCLSWSASKKPNRPPAAICSGCGN